MRESKWLVILTIGTAWLTTVVFEACGQQHCRCGQREEPFFKFMDDLHNFHRPTAQRNPYEKRIETDRHDFTQSTTTVGRGVVQVEAGYTYFYLDENEEIEHGHATPEIMLRLGLSEDIEFRLRWTYAWRFLDEENNLDSAQDLLMSLKLAMTDQCGWTPESAFVLRGTAPTGGSNWTLGRAKMGVDLIGNYDFWEYWKFFGSSGYSQGGLGDFSLLPEEPETENFAIWSASLGFGVETTENSTFYSEWFALISDGLPNHVTVAIYNIGIDYYVTDNFVLDVRFGVGLNEQTDDFFSGIGGGLRF